MPITKKEFLDYLQTDAELRSTASDESSFDGESFVFFSDEKDWEGCWIAWLDGKIYSKNPDEKMIKKMIQIAELLDASVVGDNN